MKEPKFLFAPDEATQSLFILHRQFPACLIEVVQSTPVKFKIVDLYDEIDKDVLVNHPVLNEAKNFFREHFKSKSLVSGTSHQRFSEK